MHPNTTPTQAVTHEHSAKEKARRHARKQMTREIASNARPASTLRRLRVMADFGPVFLYPGNVTVLDM
jgi:hypothetical protein